MKIYYRCSKYNNLFDLLSDRHYDNQDTKLQDAMLLVKHHLFRPDETGMCCKRLIEDPVLRNVPLEFFQQCLPDKNYLLKNPKFVDDLRNAALAKAKAPAHLEISRDIIEFLFDRDSVLNCKVRDEYFYNVYQYEMKMVGALNGEYLVDLEKRKPQVNIESVA